MILVTGGTGLVGSHILLELTKKHSTIRALTRSSSSLSIINKVFNYYNSTHLLEKIQWVEGDLLDVISLEDAMEDCKQVYHTAALVSFSKKDHDQIMETNISGTANIVNICLDKGIEKLGYVSSIASLNRCHRDQKLINEEDYWKSNNNSSVYSISKYLAEQEVWRGVQEGLNAIIINPSVILGPGNWNKGSSKIFQKVYTGLKIYTDGVTGYVDVLDVTDALIQLMNSNIINERYILNSENLSYQTIFNSIAEVMKKPEPNIKASPFLKEIAWRIEAVRSFLTGKTPLLTKETANQAMSKAYYSNRKITDFGFKFRPIKTSIENYSNWFLKEI